MVRLTSIQQALSLRGTIPELAIIRAMQFMGDGYDPEQHGHIIVIQEGDDITQIKEVGEDGLFDDDVPTFEYVEAFVDGDQVTFELVYQLDDSRTVAVIADADCLDDDLRNMLLELSPPQLLPRKALENTLV
jgi:hypothetical protein